MFEASNDPTANYIQKCPICKGKGYIIKDVLTGRSERCSCKIIEEASETGKTGETGEIEKLSCIPAQPDLSWPMPKAHPCPFDKDVWCLCKDTNNCTEAKRIYEGSLKDQGIKILSSGGK